MHIADNRPDARQRELAAMGQKVREPSMLKGGQTSLMKGLSEWQQGWLTNYCVERWNALYPSLALWRAKLAKYERMAEDQYSDRKGRPDQDKTSALKNMFNQQNDNLGVVSGMGDFVYAQARDDIFGTRPWLAATPKKSSGDGMAEKMTKHSQNRFDQSDIEAAFIDSIRTVVDLGTAFVKMRWIKDIEEFETVQYVAHLISTGKPITDAGGEFVTGLENMPVEYMADGSDVEWREMLVQQTQTVYNNPAADVLDYMDVAFDLMAKDIDLRHTEFFHKTRIGLLDAISLYGLTDEQAGQLRNSITNDDERARGHRDEQAVAIVQTSSVDLESNPAVTVVEGYVRVDPFRKGKPKRIQAVFLPEIALMVSCDYLAEVTPDGIVPVFPVRCFKIPNRIVGRGYFERFEDGDTAIDLIYNSVTYHNRKASVPISGVHMSALAEESERDVVFDPDNPFKLAEDKKLSDFIEFAAYPDLNTRSVELLNQMLQLLQMRTGITSAAQGELKGVPNANTATGVRQLMSRGATLVKWPIDQIMRDLEKPVEFAVFMLYANQDEDETFTWGEGEDAEEIEIKSDEVKNLRAAVSLTLTQSQSQTKLESAQIAAGLGMQYVGLPETEKAGQRRLYVQAIAALGFNDAEKIIRAAAVDPMSLLQILPPDLQPMFMAFLQQSGMAPPVPTAPGKPAAATSPGPEAAPPPATGQPPPTPFEEPEIPPAQ